MILAHQGGWDELLLVIVPITVVAGLLGLAQARVKRHGPPEPPDGDERGATG